MGKIQILIRPKGNRKSDSQIKPNQKSDHATKQEQASRHKKGD